MRSIDTSVVSGNARNRLTFRSSPVGNTRDAYVPVQPQSFGLKRGGGVLARARADRGHTAQLRCRFRDCAHAGEPRCAVAAEIEPGRLERWRSLRAELAYLDRRDDPALLAAERKIWKARTKAQRRHRGER